MQIFLTGGTGFIGSHFINEALANNIKLICLKRPKSQPRIPLIDSPLWVEGQLDDNLENHMEGCDILVHLASHSTNAPYDSIENCLYWNLTSSLKLLQSAKKVGVKKFVVAGTGFEYGRSGERYNNIPITAPLEPTMTYPASKAASFMVIFQWALENKVQLHYLRIFQVFGEGENEKRLWPSLKKAALAGEDFLLTGGDQIRDFTPVDKVVSYLIQSLKFDKINYGHPIITNIGTGQPKTLRQFAEYWWHKWAAKGKLKFGE